MPAAPAANASAAIEAGRGEVRPIPATEPDKLMLDRASNPPGQKNPDRPAAKGLPTAKPVNEDKLAELKADADFAAKAEKIHGDIAAGAVQEAARIEAESEQEVRERMAAPDGEEGLARVEPGAGESKEATKEFLSETSNRSENKPNPLIQPTAMQSKVATEKHRDSLEEPAAQHDNPEGQGEEGKKADEQGSSRQ